ncbi:MAG: T9SS type A sorting domain-containing protein [Bacteroidetes bacterium]|nr:T9SS type A sorting domain-containing protein [Bacteroidota bacterium]
MRCESILQIAIQCPYSGGAAVSTALTFVSLLNDTMEYGDDAICGVMGIFRLQNTKEKIAENQITMFPNPSTGVVQVVFEGLDGDKINVEVFDVLGKLIFTKKMLTNSNTISLTINNFNNGLYNVKLFDQLGNHVTGKYCSTNDKVKSHFLFIFLLYHFLWSRFL